MYIDGHPHYICGERVQGKLGSVVEQADLNVDAMLDRIFGPRPVLTAVTSGAEAQADATTTQGEVA
jgi:hypothetical protein